VGFKIQNMNSDFSKYLNAIVSTQDTIGAKSSKAWCWNSKRNGYIQYCTRLLKVFNFLLVSRTQMLLEHEFEFLLPFHKAVLKAWLL